MGRITLIVIEQHFLNYLHSLKEELYRDPTTFVPKYTHAKTKYDHDYYMKNRERIKEQQRKYNQKPEVKAKHLAVTKAWALAHPEQVKAKRRAYEERNRDKINARNRERYWRLKGLKK